MAADRVAVRLPRRGHRRGRSGALQFLTESLILGYASNRGRQAIVPWYVPIGGVAAAIAIGAVAGCSSRWIRRAP
ncbi:MAG TPA: hypothetical protein VNJ46_05400 [Gaiellaceae bacterium]|nr:hypothetical protein [Gaiellaceae bacterium]